MAKLIDMSLPELYAKEKITLSVEQAIAQKEDFSGISINYCEKVCKLKCKGFENVQLWKEKVDVLIIQDHKAMNDYGLDGKIIKSGDELERLYMGIVRELAEENLKGLKYMVLNLLKCPVKKDDMKGINKPPLATTLLKCKPYLLEEIKRMQPKVIISLTTNVTKALGLVKSNATNRGEIHGNVVLTVHPKAATMIRQNATGAFWGPDFFGVLQRDFKKAGMLARGEMTIPSLEEALERFKKNIVICRSMEDVKREAEAILKLPKKAILSFDLETTSLDPWIESAKIITAQFGYRLPNGELKSVVFPMWHRENKWYDADKAWEYVKAILLSDLPKIGHNIKFDVLYTYATTKVRVNNIVFDTLLLLHAINSGIQGNYGLKRGVWDWLPELGVGGYEDKLPKLSKSVKKDEEDNNEEEVEE